MSTQQGAPDEFYVGDLTPAPRGVARQVRRWVVVIAATVAAAAGLVALGQGSAGDGVWDSTLITVTGLFVAEPCPMLRVMSPGQSEARTILLVGQGKCGALEPRGYCGPVGPTIAASEQERAAARQAIVDAFGGRLVTVSGTALSRDGRMMIELGESDRSMIAAPEDPGLRQRLDVAAADLGESTVRGVIVDPKCYMGAMKPGAGKSHRACAVRCISGGIPPVLVVAGTVTPEYLILADSKGRALREGVLPYVADLVEIRGRIEQRGDLRILRVESAISRL